MADTASSSDSVSESYPETFSDISSEKSLECYIVGQKPQTHGRRKERNLLQKLFTRETRGCLSMHNYAAEERLFNSIPSWCKISLQRVLPKSALEAGHIVMGLTQCGQFLLTYTYTIDVSGHSSMFKYLLHWWAFVPNRVSRKVAEVTLFGNYTIYKELNIVIAQWPLERNKLMIHGLDSRLNNSQTSHPTDKAYITITTVPSLDNCKDCMKVAASYEEEELAANWEGCVRCNCLQHGLTVHTTYEVISPFPKFRADLCLSYCNHVVINTGNFLHVLRVDFDNGKSKGGSRGVDKQGSIADLPIDVSDAEDTGDDSKLEQYDILDEKINTPESLIERDSNYSSEFASAEPSKFDESSSNNELHLSTSCSNQCDNICDSNKCSDSSSTTVKSTCEVGMESIELKCESPADLTRIEQQGISVRDKILQDFCEDASQELNIASEMITLVKHSSCSPRSTPQRLPLDLRPLVWPMPIFHPPSDILRIRESSHKTRQRSNSPQPGASQEASVNSPLHSLSISPPSPCSPRLMSPPVTRWFKPKKRPTLCQNPTARSPMPTRATRATHKIIMEGDKAYESIYEFTDDVQETCEKLSSFRKRRLAEKKYEFCDEAEDVENIIPFKHLRDQSKYLNCCATAHQIPSSAMSPSLQSNKRHFLDAELSETDEYCTQDCYFMGDYQGIENEKSVLRPLNQNQLTNQMLLRERSAKSFCNVSPLIPKEPLQSPIIKCITHFKRSYIELDDEIYSVITDVEDEETGGYVSYQCVLPMLVHGSGYVQMQMISNSKAEKIMVPCVSINQSSFDIETFLHYIADWICVKFKKKFWHCTDYDIEIIDICALTGDIICLLIMKIEVSDPYQVSGSHIRKHIETGCTFTWNIESNQYKIIDVLPAKDVGDVRMLVIPKWPNEEDSKDWNPTKLFTAKLRANFQQPYARKVRFLLNEMVWAGESIMRLHDFDNLVEFYLADLESL